MTIADQTPADGEKPLLIEVLRGAPTAEELAAVAAVVTESYESEVAGAIADDAAARSAWEISARALRRPLLREIGWRGAL